MNQRLFRALGKVWQWWRHHLDFGVATVETTVSPKLP